jgi:hypothetical protein
MNTAVVENHRGLVGAAPSSTTAERRESLKLLVGEEVRA